MSTPDPTDDFYLQARAIKTGQYQLYPGHQHLMDWIWHQFKVKALDFSCRTVETWEGEGRPRRKQQFLNVMLETIADRTHMEKVDNQKLVAQKFKEFFTASEKPEIKNDKFKADVFSIDEKPFPEVVVMFTTLEEHELLIANTKATSAVLSLKKKYEDQIWGIDSIDGMNPSRSRVIFYYTDQQLQENSINGITQNVQLAILKELKKYDSFNYFGIHSITYHPSYYALALTFDSKETFDRDYGGNWHSYIA